jgi:hypothetical protein
MIQNMELKTLHDTIRHWYPTRDSQDVIEPKKGVTLDNHNWLHDDSVASNKSKHCFDNFNLFDEIGNRSRQVEYEDQKIDL